MKELAPWIARRRRVLARAAEELARPAGTVPYLGQALTLVPQPGRERVHRRGDMLLVPAGDPHPALERFYRRAARAEIAARLDAATARAGSRYSGADDPRPAHALGVVLVGGRDVVQLAPAARSRRRSSTTWSSTRSATSR